MSHELIARALSKLYDGCPPDCEDDEAIGALLTDASARYLQIVGGIEALQDSIAQASTAAAVRLEVIREENKQLSAGSEDVCTKGHASMIKYMAESAVLLETRSTVCPVSSAVPYAQGIIAALALTELSILNLLQKRQQLSTHAHQNARRIHMADVQYAELLDSTGDDAVWAATQNAENTKRSEVAFSEECEANKRESARLIAELPAPRRHVVDVIDSSASVLAVHDEVKAIIDDDSFKRLQGIPKTSLKELESMVLTTQRAVDDLEKQFDAIQADVMQYR